MAFANDNYDVNFPMFAKVEVNGANACDLYQQLKAAKADEEGKADIGWNFTKFLVNGNGDVVARYGPKVTPEEIAVDLPNHMS